MKPVRNYRTFFFILFCSLALVGCNAGPGEPNTQNQIQQITFAQLQLNVLGPYCVSCHTDVTPNGGVSFESYDATMVSAGAVVPYQPHQSQMYKQVLWGKMPPSGSPAPSAAELQQIYNWIALGALNN